MKLSNAKWALIFTLFFNVLIVKAQEIVQEKMKDTSHNTDVVDFGIGLGLDYGGYGGQIVGYPQKNLGIVLGLGYNGIGLGYNAGLKGRLLFHKSDPTLSPFILGMYGYTAAVKVTGPNYYSSFKKQFNGFTIGAGLDIRIGAAKIGYFSCAVLMPFRGSEYDNYINNLKVNYGVKFDQELWPVGFSLGYKFILSRSK